jgi:protoporphyrinogen oxidase
MTTPLQTPRLHWGIVGGGMLGLTLAHRLARRGQRVTVLEEASEIGGLAAAWRIGDVAWDKHYHVTLLSDSHLRGLLRDLDLESDVRWVETKTGFYTDGQLHSMSSTWEFLRFPPLGIIDKLRLGLTIFAASRRKNWRPLEHVLVANWLRKWSGERTFRKIWLPLLQAKLGDAYRHTSAAFIWATIARMYAARRTGLKKELFGYVPGGYARVLERFANVLRGQGLELRTNCRVREVMSRRDGAVDVELEQDLSGRGRESFATGESPKAADQSGAKGSRPRRCETFDRVVLTCPSPVVARVCSQLDDDERRRHENIPYLGIICASLRLKHSLAGFYVTNITDSGLPFTAVIEMTALVDPRELGGQALIYLPRYATANDKAWDWSDGEIEERFLSGLERMYPAFRRSDLTAFRISRVKHVMALPTLGYSASLPPMTTAAGNVFAVNSAHIVKGTLNVNEVVELADDAFAAVLAPSLYRGAGSRHSHDSEIHDYAASAGELIARS